MHKGHLGILINMQVPIWQDCERLMLLLWGPHLEQQHCKVSSRSFHSQLIKHSLEASQVPGTVHLAASAKRRQGALP